MPCRITLEWYENCDHLVSTEICTRGQLPAQSPNCTIECDIQVCLPTYHAQQVCIFCSQQAQGSIPPEARLEDLRFEVTPSLREKLKTNWPVHARRIQIWLHRWVVARHAAFSFRHWAWLSSTRRQAKEQWEAEVASFRLAEEHIQMPLRERVFFESYDDGRFYRPVELAAVADGEHCPVCLNPHDEQTRKLPCGHIFHMGCVREWLREKVVKSCPVCRCGFFLFEMPRFVDRVAEATAEE